MTAQLADLLDSLLIISGLVLVITGLVAFIRSKTSAGASSVEAFGVKLNVTHPSLILVLAGIGLMLAPRLLPDPRERRVVAEAPAAAPAKLEAPSATAPAAPPVAIAPTPNAPSVLAPTVTTTPPTPAQQPSAPRSPSQATRAAPPRETAAAATPTAQKPEPSPAPTAPSAPAPTRPTTALRAATPAAKPVQPTTAPPPAPTRAASAPATTPAPPPETLALAATPPAIEKRSRPSIAFSVLAIPTRRDFWSGETASSYTRRVHTTLQQAGRDVLRMNTRKLELGADAFDAWWNEGNDHARSRAFCAADNAPRALLAARVEQPTTTSHNESAYWPEFKLRLFLCDTQRMYRQQKTLSPLNADAWPFSTELNAEVERFMRTYRADLAD